MKRITSTAVVGLLAAGSVFLSGCFVPGHWPGGSRASRDMYTFESTLDFQQSVQVVDLATNEVIWSINVPVGEQVAIRFYDDHDPENVDRPALMRWRLMERGRRSGELHNAIPVPAYDRRLMEVYHRDEDVAPGLEVGASSPQR